MKYMSWKTTLDMFLSLKFFSRDLQQPSFCSNRHSMQRTVSIVIFQCFHEARKGGLINKKRNSSKRLVCSIHAWCLRYKDCNCVVYIYIYRDISYPRWHCHYPKSHLYSFYLPTIRPLVSVHDRFGLCRLALI